MNNSEYNLKLIREIEENRHFLLMMYRQNPELLRHADRRIPPLLLPLETDPKVIRAGQRGISLIELIMFIVIIGVALAGILLVMNQVTARSADPLIRKQAFAIAESMLEEIRLQDLSGVACIGTLGADVSRTGASSVCDYDGYSTTAGILDFSTNTPVGGLGGYNITDVAVAPIPALGGTPITPGSGVVITVTVGNAFGFDPVTATGYRAGR